MRIFSKKPSGTGGRRERSLGEHARQLGARAGARLRAGSGDEEGFLLIEVIISSMLVAVIVMATFNGFDVLNRTTNEERQHDEAMQLAAQSQEELRGDPASALATLQVTPHTYTQTVQGTVYTVKQSAELQPGTGGSKGACNVTESSRQSGNDYRITSTVSWTGLETSPGHKRPSVVASSLVTPPIGSSLEVDVENSPSATAGVEGVSAIVKYTPEGSTAKAQEEGTTGSEGCLIFGDIPSSEAEIEIPETYGFVTVSGKTTIPLKEETLAPNYTTHYAVVFNRAGALEAKFRYNGSETAKHKNNKETGEVTQTVTGDTFVAGNIGMEETPNFEVGSTKFSGATAAPYEPLTGEYLSSAATKMNLFPFLETESAWTVYAGDCTANNPETVTSGAVKLTSGVHVPAGKVEAVTVPVSYTTLNLYSKRESVVAKATHAYEDLETTNSYPVTIDNLGCSSITPDNEHTVSYKHSQTTSIGESLGGHLTDPFQPFGKEFTMCLVDSALNQTYTVKYANSAAVGGSVSIYLPQRPASEVSAERVEEESEYKTKETAYKAKETPYKNKEGEYKAKESAYKTKESEYKAKETAYKAKESAYKTKENEYKTEKSNYERYHQTTYKTKYEKDFDEYEALKAEYNTLKGEYTTLYNEFTTLKNEYNTLKSEYTTLYNEYTTLKNEYSSAKTAYENAKAAYETDKSESIADANEAITLKNEYKTAKAAWEQAKEEEAEGGSVTVAKGTTCT